MRSVSHQVEFNDSQRLRCAQLRLLYLQDIQDPLVHIVVVSGSVVRGEPSVTAIETKLGWVLSGPIPEGTQVNRQQSNLVITHVLKSAVKPVDVINETLDGTLKTLWELESHGIKLGRCMKNSKRRYPLRMRDLKKVHLPWKTPHPILPDNYQLSRKRL